MATDAQIQDIYRAAGLTESGIAYIERVRSSPPARNVGGSRFKSVSTRFASKKMGRTIQAESRTGEYPFLLSLELDDDVIEFYDQTETISHRRRRNGKLRVDTYTADYLVLRPRSVELIEVKSHKDVLAAASAYPDEWDQDQGRWFQTSVAAYFRPMGIQHWVHVAEDINPVFAANLKILVGAKYQPALPNEAAAWSAAHHAIRCKDVVTISSLCKAAGLNDGSAIFRWIAEGKLIVGLEHQFLAEVRTTRVFSSIESRDRYVAARSIGQTGDSVSRDSSTDPAIDALTDRQIALGLERYNATMDALRCGAQLTRQQRRYLHALKTAKATGANPLAAFVPHFECQGNRIRRITPEQDEVMQAAVSRSYKTAAKRSKRWVYSSINWGLVPRASYASFCKFSNQLPRHELANARSGHRAAMALCPPSHPNLRSQMPTCAWELAHVDHTKLDEKVWARLGLVEMLDRPTITILIDAWSKCVLAFWLAFSAPSVSSLLTLARDCVRRHERLPQEFISDHGPEMKSTGWEAFCAAHGCSKSDRPVANPRWGSEVENLFKQLNSGLIHQLDGNMQNDQNWRTATSTHKSNATARFSLEQLYKAIDYFLFEHYNKSPHGPSPFSPFDTLSQSAADIGPIFGTHQPFDLAFRIETAIRPRRKRYPIEGRQGLRVLERVYWHDALGDPRLQGKRVEVRLEPFDSSIIYAYAADKWVVCVDGHAPRLSRLEEFSRWAQTILDTDTKRFIRAAKRLADERFAKGQVAAWADGGNAPSAAIKASAAPKLRLRVADAAAETGSTSRTPTLLERLAKDEITPLKEVAP